MVSSRPWPPLKAAAVLGWGCCPMGEHLLRIYRVQSLVPSIHTPSYMHSAQLWPFLRSREFSCRSVVLRRIFDSEECFDNGDILDRYDLE